MEGNIKTMCDILESQKAPNENENIKIKKNLKKGVESLWSYSCINKSRGTVRFTVMLCCRCFKMAFGFSSDQKGLM